jgi:hypothetical protein
LFAIAALWFTSVGEVCALLAALGGGEVISSMLRTGWERGGLATDADLGGASPMSSMLLTGDRGVKGEADRPGAELANPLCRAGVASNKANTSFLSSSSMDSNDICFDMI